MYISRGKMIRSKIVTVIQMVIFIPFLIMNLVGTIGGIAGIEGLDRNLIVYVAGVIPSIWILYLAFTKIGLQGCTNRYNGIFEFASNKDILVSEVATKIGKNEILVMKQLERLIRKGYLVNCTLEHGLKPKIILKDKLLTNQIDIEQ